jgi:chemotaxis protein MotB
MSRQKNAHSNHERWLVSYADFITLLFAFFVVLYASAQVDKKKVGQLTASIHNAFQEMGTFPPRTSSPKASASVPSSGVVPKDELSELEQQLRGVLSQEVVRDEVSIYRDKDDLVLSLREVGFFDSGSSNIRPQAKAAFGRLAEILQRHSRRLRIEGHTDNQPIHNRRFNSNWELSTARATEVVRLLVQQYGYPPDVLAASGYGEFHPIADNSLAEGRLANRRVDVVVLADAHPVTQAADEREYR